MQRQKILSPRFMIAFIAFMNMFVPLSTDMYLPALPEMGAYFNAAQSLVSLTLTLFFFFFAVSMVMFGPLSDKYGRRAVLLAGAALYTLSSLACALAPNIYFLIVGRVVEAIGAGAIITVSTALIKDSFRGSLMKKILAVTQALGVIAPMAAPLIGGFLLTFTSWRGSFVVLTVLGLVNLGLAYLLTETLPPEKRYQGKVIHSLSLLLEFGRRKSFMMLLFVFACFSAPFMAYLNLSSFIYIENFGLSAQTYSYFFAVNSAVSVMGPFLYLRLSRRLSRFTLTNFCFGGALLSGLAVLNLGHFGAIAFLFSFVPFTILNSVTRPFSMNWLLGETKDNVGTASAVINFVQTFFGSLGMMAGSLPWPDFIDGLGIIMMTALAVSFLLWQRVKRYYDSV